MTETEKAYIAGLIDGEGNITITKNTPGRGRQCKRVQMQLRVCIYNTNEMLIDWCMNTVGYGSKYVRKSKNLKHKDGITFLTTAQQAKRLLKDVYPYLTIKKPMADLAFQFQDMLSNVYGKCGVPQEVINARLALKESMHLLNKKGPSTNEKGVNSEKPLPLQAR
jgi:hypothetical protein